MSSFLGYHNIANTANTSNSTNDANDTSDLKKELLGIHARLNGNGPRNSIESIVIRLSELIQVVEKLKG